MSYVMGNAYQADGPGCKSQAGPMRTSSAFPVTSMASARESFRLDVFSNDLRKLENALNTSFGQSCISCRFHIFECSFGNHLRRMRPKATPFLSLNYFSKAPLTF